MATFKAVVFKHHKKDDGTFNIKIRVIQNRIKRYIATPYYVTQKDLTRSYEIKNQHYIDLCDVIIKEFREKLEPFGMAVIGMTADKVVQLVTAKSEDCILLSELMEDYFKLRGISENTQNTFLGCRRTLLKAFGGEDINICELSPQNLQKWVLTLPKKSACLYVSKLNALIRFGMKTRNDEENGIKPIPYNPLEKVEVPSVSHTDKKAISADELRKFIAYKGTGLKEFAQKLFMLSFYLVGMNLVDILKLKKNDLDGEYLEYCRTKTERKRDDNAFIRIRVVTEARLLFADVYKKMHEYTYATLASILNQYLKMIGRSIGVDRIVFYSARHTWATLAVNDCKIDKYTVHLALNHVDNKTAITDVYIKKDFTAVDEANRKVIDYVLQK